MSPAKSLCQAATLHTQLDLEPVGAEVCADLDRVAGNQYNDAHRPAYRSADITTTIASVSAFASAGALTDSLRAATYP